jgi:HSP20 family protein
MATHHSMEEKSKLKEERGGGVAAKTERAVPAPYHPGTLLPTFGWEPIRRMREEFDRIFDQVFSGWPVPWERAGRDWRWGLDVEENKDNVVVRAEAPGFEPDDFDLQIRGDQLVLRAAHKAQAEERERGYREWRRQELYQSVALPPGVDAEHVQATYRNGVLTVTLPKTEDSKGRRITVRS